MKREFTKSAAWLMLYLAALYLAVCLAFYQFTHPEQTAAQVILNIKDAILWR